MRTAIAEVGSMEDKDQPVERKWSSEFVRNRAEVITLTLIFYLLTHVEGDIKSIPGGVALDHAIPKGPVLIFIFIFLLYFLLSWMLRALIDSRDGNLLKASADGFAAETAKFIERLEQSEAKWAGFELRELIEQVGDRMAKHVASVGEIPNVALTNYVEDFVQRAHGLIAFEKKRAAPGAEGEKISNMFETERVAFEKFIFSHKDAWDKEGTRVRSAVEESAKVAITDIASVTKSAIENIRDHGPKIEESLGTIVARIADMNRQLRNYRTAAGLNRMVFGFVLPWLFSVVILAGSLPQGLEDSRSSIVSGSQCLASIIRGDISCLYRNEPQPAVPANSRYPSP